MALIGVWTPYTQVIAGVTYSATDGVASVVGGNLRVLSNPFTTTHTNLFDRFKYYLAPNAFLVLSSGILAFKARMSANVNTAFSGSPYTLAEVPDPQSDLRLGYGALVFYDPISRFFFSFFITNTRIYAGYERLVDGSIPLGSVATFSSAIPVANSTAAQFHDYMIIFSVQNSTVQWVVDGVEVYKIYTIGSITSRQYMIMDGGGPQVMTYPTRMGFGFGTFNYVNAYSPCNVVTWDSEGGSVCQFPAPDRGLAGPLQTGLLNPRDGITPAAYYINPSTAQSRIWGEGVTILVNYLEILRCTPPPPGKGLIDQLIL